MKGLASTERERNSQKLSGNKSKRLLGADEQHRSPTLVLDLQAPFNH